jgi:alkanesulfonate monooxygenase SsuD/methylene tetrahydromethanopterin reductase-like flavin-dependent oxidoreductase (luciferase family)
VVTDDPTGTAERLGSGFGMPASDLLNSPHAAIGTVEQIADRLVRQREEYGFSYIVFQGNAFEAVAPVVQRLAGT